MDTNANSPESVETGLTEQGAADALLDLMQADNTDSDPQQETEEPEEEGHTEESSEEPEAETDESNEEESDEEESNEDNESEEESDGDEDAPEEDLFEVTVKDEEGNDVVEQVSTDELVKGYMRTRDYNRKRTIEGKAHKDAIKELSTVRDSLEATLAAQVTVEEQTFQQLVQQMNRAKTERPDLYPQLHYKALQMQQEVEAKRGTLNQLQQSYQAQKHEEDNLRVQQALGELKEIYPDWEQKQQVLTGYLANNGFSNEDVRGMVNPKIVELVEKARLYDEQQTNLQQASYKKVKRKPQTTLSAGTTGKADNIKSKRVHNETLERVRQTGSVDDAAAALEKLFNQ